jgi:hypothetical protein
MDINLLITAERTFNDLLREYIDYRYPKPLLRKPKKNEDTPQMRELLRYQHERSMDLWQKTVDDVLRQTMINDLTIEGIYGAIDRTIRMIKDAEYLATDVTELVKRRRLFEQIKSIIHISPAYPKDAARRLVNLNKKLVAEPRSYAYGD